MGSQCGRDGYGLLKKIEPKRPRFSKIILDDALRDGKLGIPKKFVIKHGSDISNKVTLKVPTGAEWEVELIKSNGEIWLQNGWEEFMKYYSVQSGHFLVFEYERTQYFHVGIFDTSATEIEYPSGINGNSQPDLGIRLIEPKLERTENGLGDFSACQKRKKQSPLPCTPPKKKVKTDSPTKFDRTSQCQTLVPANSTEPNLHFIRNQFGDGGPNFAAKRGCKFDGVSRKEHRLNKVNITGSMQQLTRDEKARALHKVRIGFKSQNPFFMVVMQPSYIYPGSRVTVPASFGSEYFENHGNIILHVLDGGSWPAKYYYCEVNGWAHASIDRGWKKFALDNHLALGDVCIFELIERTEVTLKVTIHRTNTEANHCPQHVQESKAEGVKINEALLPKVEADFGSKDEIGICSPSGQTAGEECINLERNLGNNKQLIPRKCTTKQFTQRRSSSKIPRSLEIADKFTSRHPFFKVVIQSYHLIRSDVTVPMKFVRKNVKESRDAMLQVADRLWPVKLKRYSRYQGKLSAGWTKFLQENLLEAGDVCMFQMIMRDPLLLNVSIFKHAA